MLSPYMINREEHERKRIEENLKAVNDDKYFHHLGEIFTDKWWARRALHHEMHGVSALMHWMSTYYPFKDYCKQNHPDSDPSRCAYVYMFAKKHHDFDRVMDFDRGYFDYTDEEAHKAPLWKLRNNSKYFLHFGLLLFLLGIKVNKTMMLTLVFFGNFAL